MEKSEDDVTDVTISSIRTCFAIARQSSLHSFIYFLLLWVNCQDQIRYTDYSMKQQQNRRLGVFKNYDTFGRLGRIRFLSAFLPLIHRFLIFLFCICMRSVWEIVISRLQSSQESGQCVLSFYDG